MTDNTLDKTLDDLLNKYVSNYNLEVLAFRQSGQATVKRAIKSLIADREEKMLEFVIDSPTGYTHWFKRGCKEAVKEAIEKTKEKQRQRAKEWREK